MRTIYLYEHKTRDGRRIPVRRVIIKKKGRVIVDLWQIRAFDGGKWRPFVAMKAAELEHAAATGALEAVQP